MRGADAFGRLAQRYAAYGRTASVVNQQQGAAGCIRDKQLPSGRIGGDAARALAGRDLAHHLVGGRVDHAQGARLFIGHIGKRFGMGIRTCQRRQQYASLAQAVE